MFGEVFRPLDLSAPARQRRHNGPVQPHTEVSFFFNGHIMTEPGQPLRPSYLADSTRPIGAGKIDLELPRHGVAR